MKVKELLSDESKWCRGSYAEDADGCNIDPHNKAACRWCLSGAIRRCYATVIASESSQAAHVYKAILSVIADVTHDEHATIPNFNDDRRRTFADIRKVLEIADV